MSVKNFKFVSPGVFINEIDNSFIPRSAEAIGPIVIGRASRGLGMTPIKVESYSQFVEMFGETVPGNMGGDISRNGNYQSPMYGTYAAKAFLDANVAPLTYVRLLGQQDSNGSSGGVAGWETAKDPATAHADNGGAWGLWTWAASGSIPNNTLTASTGYGFSGGANGTLAAVFYVDTAAAVWLSGTIGGSGSTRTPSGTHPSPVQEGAGLLVYSDTSGIFTGVITGSDGSKEKITFGFDDSADTFIRKRFNTNPQLTSDAGTFYPSDSYKSYWLGETFEQTLRDNSLVGARQVGAILPLAKVGDATTGPHYKRQASQEGRSGWFIGQDLGQAASFSIQTMQKLFRFVGRGHGEWLHKNCKVAIEQIRASTTTVSDYGTFSVVIRKLADTDTNVEVMERFDNCTLDPTSVNFVARKIGDQYVSWNTSEGRLKTYGDYPNQSKFVYVEMNADAEAGATDPVLIPYGYFGPPGFAPNSNAGLDTGSFAGGRVGYYYSGSLFTGKGTMNLLLISGASDPGPGSANESFGTSSTTGTGKVRITASVEWPSVRLRLSASEDGLSDPTRASFGIQTTRARDSTRGDVSVGDYHNLLKGGFSGGGGAAPANAVTAGIKDHMYVFSMNDVTLAADGASYFYRSGSRLNGDSVATYTDLLDAGYDSFTAPFFGGFDGFDIQPPDPLYNKGIAGAGGSGTGTATDLNSYQYYTYKRAIDTVSDPEAYNMNLLCSPGLTHNALTNHMVNVCESRADAMALIDLADIYIPPHEARKDSKADRIGTTPQAAATALKQRGIDSSYGATFYPWVQTSDSGTGHLLWIPPTVAMMGVLASSERSTAVWFAPAGFNRGGLSDGAAGIPVLSVSERLTSRSRDTLYEQRINPIASFPSSGIVVFGQKTLQQRQSALDRINVRRLVIYLKKQISILSTKILFEQNVQDTWNRFTGLIEPLLANTKAQFGITDYKLILDETTTTPDLIDQNILYAKIMIKPARAIEYIAIDFVIMSTGASFDD